MASWFNKIKAAFGYFNLTEFEAQLLASLKCNLSKQGQRVMESQFEKFNQVDRIITQGPATPYGHTSFYWSRFGQSMLNFPELFEGFKQEEKLATMDAMSLADNNLIKISFYVVNGILFSIEYRSKKYQYTPSGEYEVSNIKVNEKYCVNVEN